MDYANHVKIAVLELAYNYGATKCNKGNTYAHVKFK